MAQIASALTRWRRRCPSRLIQAQQGAFAGVQCIEKSARFRMFGMWGRLQGGDSPTGETVMRSLPVDVSELDHRANPVACMMLRHSWSSGLAEAYAVSKPSIYPGFQRIVNIYW